MTIFVSLLNVSLETRVEAIPRLLHDLFDRLSQQEVIPFKPDYCVIDIFSEVISFFFCLRARSIYVALVVRAGPLTLGMYIDRSG
jgi:hypothetical protein